MTFFLTIAGFITLIIGVESVSWILFRRKAEGLRFPTEGDASGSHHYWLRKLRIFAIMHTIILITFVIIFCSILW